MRAALRFLLLGLSAAPAVAQAVRWRLPERGGAIYARTLVIDNRANPAGADVPQVFDGPDPAAIVLDGEFDRARVRRAEPVRDVRELVAQLGHDVDEPRGGKTEVALFGGNRFQPVRVDASFDPPGADGRQRFEATITPDVKAARRSETPGHLPLLTGRVEGTRSFDAARGLVTAIDGAATLTFVFAAQPEREPPQPERTRTVQLRDSWRDPVVLAPGSPELQTRITEAIRASIAFLRGRIEESASRVDEPTGGDPYHDIQPGELALMLLALRHGGEAASDPLLTRGYSSLRRRIIAGTYSLAVAILAVEALYTPAGEWELMRTGQLTAPLPRAPSPEDQKLLSGWVESLLGNIDKTTDAAYLRRWHYGPSQDFDNSNTQYALLGLYGAQLCGIEISPQVWTAAANHWLDCAIEQGDAAAPDLVLHRDAAKGGRTRAGARVPPRGWGYAREDATGSMTTAGISGLTLCSAGLRMFDKGNPKLLRGMDTAVRSGFLWLQDHFTVRGNPGATHAWNSWHLYYLYGLERACELNRIARLGDRDWYFEGALQLLATQAADGSWGSWPDTAFGLLFLKKAALPAITGR